MLLSFVRLFTQSRSCWLLLIMLGIGLEGCGLYFQYQLHLDPCVNCIYERAYILGFIAAGIVGLIMPKAFLCRFIATLGLLTSSAFGLWTAIEHWRAAYDTSMNAQCQLRAHFPSFMPLDEWLPWIFRPQGACGPLDWELLSLSMPAWMVIIFSCGVVASLLIILSWFKRAPRYSYGRSARYLM